MRHEVIVCTKDRPVELRRCLAALQCQDVPPSHIVVVDSSRDMTLLPSQGQVPVLHVPASPGLTHQRNVGLRLLSPDTDVVHFLDDDAVPEPDYLRHMTAAFATNAWAAGVGATITNLPQHKPWRLERLFGLNSRRPGALLRSGVNILAFPSETFHEVDWLSGCCMSFRICHIQGLAFDERRTGNGIGEDVDFSARVRERGPLVYSPLARVAHLQSLVNRDSAAAVVRHDVRNRWCLAVDGVGGVKRAWIMYGTIGYVLIQIGRALRGRTMGPLVSAKAAVLGLIDIARAKTL